MELNRINTREKTSGRIGSDIGTNWLRRRDELAQTSGRFGPDVGTIWLTNLQVLTIFSTRLSLLLFTLFFACSGAWAQVTGDQYRTTYTFWGSIPNREGIDQEPILHRKAKWYEFRNQLTDSDGDTFDDEGTGFTPTLEGNAELQATHTYVDTIYMHKGTQMTLMIPYAQPVESTGYANGDDVSLCHYQRWFDYRTDGTYRCEYETDEGTVYDLLTPWSRFTGTAYRFANGYLQIGVNSRISYGNLDRMDFYYPTDEEFAAIKEAQGDDGTFKQPDNYYYVVGCDVSNYNDQYSGYVAGGFPFGLDDNRSSHSGRWYEPTLGGRAVFYIIGVEEDIDEMPDIPDEFLYYFECLDNELYHGGTNTGEEKYLEEYEITYPSRRTSNRTNELVALSKMAQSYAIPGEDPDNMQSLNVSITNNSAGIALDSWYTFISGNQRIVQFYKEGYYGTPWKVDDGSTATVLFTKTVDGTTYNIARFKLTFKDSATPLTQTQVAGLGTYGEDVNYWWKDMTYRSPQYMRNNYDLLDALTFSYDTSINASTVYSNGGYSQYYPFPLNWTSSGYAFYDGCSSNDNDGLTGFAFCMYGITNQYNGDDSGVPSPPTTDLGKDASGYWLRLDASDSPGEVAELSFEEKLCLGSQLIGTAWIKSAGNSSSDDAAVLLTIMGVNYEYDAQGNVVGETHEPIYRQCSSQIRTTTYLSDQTDEDGLGSDVTGKGSGTNQWFQLYFSFVNKADVDYDHYTLRVDNYCASTAGGDFYIDEVEVYIMRPEVGMAQLEPVCTTDEDMSLMRLSLNYETIMSRLGYEVNDSASYGEETTAVDLVIINKSKYYNYLDDVEAPTMTDSIAAFEASMVTFYDRSGDSETGWQIPEFTFYPNYGVNPEYGEGGPAVFTDGVGYMYKRLNDGNEEELSVDCSTDMVAYTPYIVILQPHSDMSEDEKVEYFVSLLDDECAIRTEFNLTATTIMKINGEMVDPETDYCAGQVIVVAPEMTYTDEDGNLVYLDNMYFDWFFGSVEEYTQANSEFNGVSLYEALIAFRNEYPDAEELSPTATPTTEFFTEDHYEIIEYYLGTTRRGGYNNMLVLHTSHLEMRVLSTGITLVIQPIEQLVEEGTVEVCFGYVPLSLVSSGAAPTIQTGFGNIEYPDGNFSPSLRMGLAQIERCTEETPLTVNLCNATYVDEAYKDVIHLGRVAGLEELFLVDTDDPAYDEVMQDSAFTQFSLPVGRLAHFYATVDGESDDESIEGSYMQFYFFDEDSADGTEKRFAAREGYYYVVNVFFEEQNAEGEYVGDDSDVAMCQGSMPLEIKVVPEYLVWTGDRTTNWNNDSHWKRADRGEIHKAESDTYPSNAENGTDRGFVPMLFSKVIMPRDSEAELYMAGFIPADGDVLTWEGDESTANHEDVEENPTSNIMYDMMVYENPSTGALKTEHYRVNLCGELHFEPGARLLHAEQLMYDKVWTDVELAQGPWMLAATPLRDVVSGDWYTKAATGTETAEYFSDIVFSADSCDRLDPMVYQRNWSNEGNTIVYSSGSNKTVPAYATTGWSSVYNDVLIPHQAGEGFSIKASRALPVGSEESLMFRFPKADEAYTYQDGGETATINRDNAGKLLISGLVDRSDPDGDDDAVYTGTQLTVELTQTDNGYYIIGNPYTAPMSMSAFMEENTQFVGYWLESTFGPVVGTGEVNSWGTDDCLIEPYSAFFVTTDAENLSTLADGPAIVTFTKDMQTLELELQHPPVRRQTNFAIRAEGEGGATSASIVYTAEASDNYSAGEDAVLMEDASWLEEGLPLVYSVAGDKAVSVNSLRRLALIPIGVFAEENEPYTLSFAGVSMLETPVLIDAYEDTETPITEDFSLEMEGPSHGRYFIRAMSPVTTDIEETASSECEVSVYSPASRTIVVSCDAGLESVELYSLGGILLRRVSAGGSVSCTIDGIASGIAIVRVKTATGIAVKKLRVR